MDQPIFPVGAVRVAVYSQLPYVGSANVGLANLGLLMETGKGKRIMNKFVLLTALVCGVFAMSANATSITYDILDIADFANYSDSDLSQTWTGDGFIGMYDDSFVHLFGIEIEDFSRTALNVDVSALAGATITSAYLEFVLDFNSGTTQDVTVTSFDADGTLGYFWDAPTVEGSQVYSVSAIGANSLDVTALLQSRVSANEDWFGLHLQGSTEFQYTYMFDSPDDAMVRLVVEYDSAPIPEPATLSLLGLGLAGLVVRSRRNKNVA